MTSGFVVLLIVVGVLVYAAVGLFYGRHQYVTRYRIEVQRRRERYPSLWEDDPDRERRDARRAAGVSDVAAMCAVFWPLAVVIIAVKRGMRGWWNAPIERDEQRAAQLRADAEAWDEKRTTGTPAEREMAAELARMCRQRAKEIEV